MKRAILFIFPAAILLLSGILYAQDGALGKDSSVNQRGGIMLKKLTVNLMVKDVNSTIDYYTDILDFELVMSVPEEGEFDWAMVKRDGVELMFQSFKSMKGEYPLFKDTEPGGTLLFYIDVEGLNDLYEGLKGKADIIIDKNRTFYNADEFAIKDCNGYILTFAEMVK